MKNSNNKSLYTNVFWAVVILMTIAIGFSFFSETASAPVQLSINELVTKINAGQVDKVLVNGNNLSITLKSGESGVARKENESGLTETLKNYGVDPKALQAVSLEVQDESGLKFWLGILVPTILPLIIIGVMFWFVFRKAQTGAGGGQAFTFGRANLKLFGAFKDRVTFKEVAGLKEAKAELVEVVDFLKNPKKYLEIGARIPRGVLLMGQPGTGKTLLARAVAGEANVPFFHISASEFVEMFVGVGASRTRDAFMTARKAAPSILFIDEIDAVGRERGTGMGGGHDEREQTLNQILVEMDGFERDTRVIVMAATNRPDVLDAALLRPGRFDRRVMLDLPDIKDREEILKVHARGKMLDKGIDLNRVAVRTPGFSGADLANLMNEAAISAARNNRKLVSQTDILESIEKVILGPERKGRVVSDREKKITAYHEAGHALVAASLKDADPVQKISIISRGSAGGYTMKLPLEENRLHTKTQYIADIAMMVGGYASEKIVFGDITTGASNDLKQASELARSLVTKYGMSEKLGPLTFGHSDESVFFGRAMGGDRNYSEKTAIDIDVEVNSFIERAYEAAKKIITTRKKALDAIAKALLEKETLEHEDFYAILKPFDLKPLSV